MKPKKLLRSKTAWVSILTIAAGVVTYLSGAPIISENPAIVSGLVVALGLINLGLRFLTTAPIE